MHRGGALDRDSQGLRSERGELTAARLEGPPLKMDGRARLAAKLHVDQSGPLAALDSHPTPLNRHPFQRHRSLGPNGHLVSLGKEHGQARAREVYLRRNLEWAAIQTRRQVNLELPSRGRSE